MALREARQTQCRLLTGFIWCRICRPSLKELWRSEGVTCKFLNLNPVRPQICPQLSVARTESLLKNARQQQSKQRRLERYQELVALHAEGYSQSGISGALDISIKTVRRWLRSGQFPERKPVVGRYSHVREFEGICGQRWEQGCHNSYQLFREIRLHGYRGSRQMCPTMLPLAQTSRYSSPADTPACAERRGDTHLETPGA